VRRIDIIGISKIWRSVAQIYDVEINQYQSMARRGRALSITRNDGGRKKAKPLDKLIIGIIAEACGHHQRVGVMPAN